MRTDFWTGRLKRSRNLFLFLGICIIVSVIVVPQLLNAYGAPPEGTTLISKGRPAIASSTNSVNLPPQAVVDDNPDTYWSSTPTNPQWLAIDLGEAVSIKQVVLQWGPLYGTTYLLEVSDNGSDWTTIHTQNAGKGQTETIDSSGQGRYIRLVASSGPLREGLTVHEFQVYGTTTPSEGESTPTQVNSTVTPENTPKPESTSTPTVTATPPGGNTSTPSEETMPVGDLPGWRQVFTEDFNTDAPIGGFMEAYKDQFTFYADGWPDTAGQKGDPSRYYPSKVVSASGGLLDLYLHTEDGTPMAAALLPIIEDHTYGKYTIRFKSDPLPGFKTAWLLWPDTDDWNEGEIDFPEGSLDGNIHAFMHPIGLDGQDAFDTDANYQTWHTASIEWTEGKVDFILDGKIIGTSTSKIPNTPFHWVIQTESCLNGCPDPSTAGHLQIDWAVAYLTA